MARKKLAALAAPFQGRWRIGEMDLWGNEALDLVEPAFLKIKGQQGEMRFIAVQAWLDIRYDARAGGPLAEFSWEGIDEGDQRSGRGWVVRIQAEAAVENLKARLADLDLATDGLAIDWPDVEMPAPACSGDGAVLVDSGMDLTEAIRVLRARKRYE